MVSMMETEVYFVFLVNIAIVSQNLSLCALLRRL